MVRLCVANKNENHKALKDEKPIQIMVELIVKTNRFHGSDRLYV